MYSYDSYHVPRPPRSFWGHVADHAKALVMICGILYILGALNACSGYRLFPEKLDEAIEYGP